MTAPVEITILTKSGGPLTKRVTLLSDGSIKSDGSACVMAKGWAQRFQFGDMATLAAKIANLRPDEALALGAMRQDLPPQCFVVAKAARQEMNVQSEGWNARIIARTGDYFCFQSGEPTLVLLDFDQKGMPFAVGERLAAVGGFWQALASIVPAMANIASVDRASTSAGLYNELTGQRFSGSGGLHVYIVIKDGTDTARFLRDLHKRCWLAGLGWYLIGKAGQLLERSITDYSVGSPERLVFEGEPVLDPPLAQDQEARRPRAHEGDTLDSLAACPPLSSAEEAQLSELRAKAAAALKPERTRARKTFIDQQASKLAQRTGIDPARDGPVIERQCDGVLLPGVELAFDEDEFAGATVGEVLEDPGKFEGATLADPVEGIEYGRCKARIMRFDNGEPWINSFAHGGVHYSLRYDFSTAQSILENAADDRVVDCFVQVVVYGDLDPVEIERLINLAHKRSSIGKRALRQKLKGIQNRARQSHRRPAGRPFTVINGCLAILNNGPSGVEPVPLANFAADIVEDQIFDDGAVEQRRYKIHGTLSDGTELPVIIVPATEYFGAGWVGPRWGARAIVYTGLGTSTICEAIQTVSGAVAEKHIFGHLGWRKVDDEWLYLHAGGAIGADGPVPAITVEIEGELSFFALPEPGDLIVAVRISIDLLRLNPTIACAVWRAPLGEFCPINLSVFTEGRTGSLKSALHGVAQSHWGARWGEGLHFPANWSSTANFLEKTAFLAKDCLFAIDDFVPNGSRMTVHDLHQRAEQVMRAQGNLGGRGRLDRTTRTRPTYYPRGLIASSGEDVPRGQSLRARMIIDPIAPNAIDPAKLAALQKAATGGLLAEAMAGYVQYLAERANTGEFRDQLAREQTRLSGNFLGEHRRTAYAAASLMLGAEIFLDFALEIDAVGDIEAARLLGDAEARLGAITAIQAVEQQQEDPVDIFVNAIPALLAAGKAHLADKDGSKPGSDPSLLGWRESTRYDAQRNSHTYWVEQGDRIGWLADGQVWLLPDVSVAAVERLLRDQGRSLGIGRNALGKRLREKDWLVETDRGSFTRTKRTNAGPARVFVLSAARLLW
jgi:hypothetical protein